MEKVHVLMTEFDQSYAFSVKNTQTRKRQQKRWLEKETTSHYAVLFDTR